jgi:FixJ family two-component response regulator
MAGFQVTAEVPDGTWIDVRDIIAQVQPEILIIVTDPKADERLWAEVLNRGAYDLLAQPFYEPEVRRVLTAAVSFWRMTSNKAAQRLA